MESSRRLKALARNPGDFVARKVSGADGKVDEAIVRIGVGSPQLQSTDLYTEPELCTLARCATRVAVIASTAATRNVERNELVVNSRRKERGVVLQAESAHSFEAGLVRERSLWLQTLVDSRRATRLVSQLRRGGCLERRRDVGVGAVGIRQARQKARCRADGLEQPLAGVVGVGGRDESVFDPEANRIGTRTRRKAEAITQLELLAQVRPNRRNDLSLIQRDRSALDAGRWTGGCCSRRRRNIVAVGKISPPVVLELQIGSHCETIVGAQCREGDCRPQISARRASIDVDDAKCQWIVQPSRSDITRGFDFRSRDCAPRCDAQL